TQPRAIAALFVGGNLVADRGHPPRRRLGLADPRPGSLAQHRRPPPLAASGPALWSASPCAGERPGGRSQRTYRFLGGKTWKRGLLGRCEWRRGGRHRRVRDRSHGPRRALWERVVEGGLERCRDAAVL